MDPVEINEKVNLVHVIPDTNREKHVYFENWKYLIRPVTILYVRHSDVGPLTTFQTRVYEYYGKYVLTCTTSANRPLARPVWGDYCR